MTEGLLMGLLGLALVLAVTAAWERRLRREREAATRAALAEARQLGTDRPLMQHPLIHPLRCLGCGTCVRACPEEGVLALRHGRAVLVNASRCLGHARCEAACPVGAIRVNLGALAGSPDIPRVSPSQESSVPGLFLAGEITGVALIRNAVAHGLRAVDAVARRVGAGQAGGGETPDLLIAGFGPAGLAAALRAREVGLRFLVLEQEGQPGGTLLHYPRRKLIMTEPLTLPLYGKLRRHEYFKEELLPVWAEAVRRFRLPVRTGVRVTGVAREGEGFRVETTAGVFRSRFVLLALGRRGTPRKLGVPGEDLGKVAYRLVDAAQYSHCHVLVVGGGDSAAEAALALAAQPGTRVRLSYRKEHFFRLKARNERRLMEAARRAEVELLLGTQVEAIEPRAVRLRRGPERLVLPNDYVFVFAGGIPPFGLLREAGVRFGAEKREAVPVPT